MTQPDWWPWMPYPESVFPMQREEYERIVPDPHTRTALSGCLGRLFWTMAEEAILEAAEEAGVDLNRRRHDPGTD